jgi:hypothetical protein
MTITKFTIFGERNSGTNYLQKIMLHNFDLKLTWEYGWKHWYIKNLDPRPAANTTTDNTASTPIQNSKDTLVILIVRNPIDWLRAMHKFPHHAKANDSTVLSPPGFDERVRNLEFSTFIRNPWLCYETTANHPLLGPQRHANWTKTDEEPYYFIEEAKNLCVLRNMKNAHFLRIGDVCNNFYIVRQESLKKNLHELSIKFKLGTKPITFPDYRAPTSYPVPELKDLNFIKKTLDMNIEKRFGYEFGK